MMFDTAWGSCNVGDIADSGLAALEIDKKLIGFCCTTDQELEACDLSHAVLDGHLIMPTVIGEAVVCQRCGRSLVGDAGPHERAFKAYQRFNQRMQSKHLGSPVVRVTNRSV